MIERALAVWRGRRAHALILLYHRVARVATDRWSLAVTPGRFAEHLDLLRRRAAPVSLSRVARSLEGGSLPAKAVAVTFDDGYADNLHEARPLLERYDIPATVFVSTGAGAQGREFWWDELERIVFEAVQLPRTLALRLGAREHCWHVATTASDTGLAGSRTGVDPTTVPDRHALFDALWRVLRDAHATERDAALAELRAVTGTVARPRPSHRPLTPEETRQLAQHDLIEIGAHTVSHARLAALPADAQEREIVGSRSALEALLERPVRSFAYPFGRAGDYTPETMRIVRDAGFSCACINVEGRVERSTDPLALPRLYVRDWGVDELAARLRDCGVRV